MEDVKKQWDEYSKMLDSKMEMHINLFNEIRIERTQQRLNAPGKWELTAAIAFMLFGMYLGLLAWNYIENPFLSLTASLSSISGLILAILSLLRFRAIKKASKFDQSVRELQTAINEIELFKSRTAWLEILANGFALIFMWPAILKSGFNYEITSNYNEFLLFIGLALLISVPVAIFTERKCRKRIKDAREQLAKLANWESAKSSDAS